MSERSLDYAQAQESFRAALPLMKGIRDQSRAIRGLIITGLFYDAPAALALADQAVAEAAALQPPDKHLEALFRTLRGRVLTNLGRPAEAKTELQTAVKLLGGLSQRVDAADLAARSDLAIAALLSGDDETAREYLAWTGAGQFRDGFPSGAEMTPPPCGGDLKPDDVAVVEFWIKDDGSVGAATPVYASRPGESALAFARAVSGWSWKPEEVRKIGSLFRAMTRVEMRCSTAGQRPSVYSLLGKDLDAWLASRGLPQDEAEEETGDARRLKPLREGLARLEASGQDSLAMLPILVQLSRNALVPREESIAYLARAEQIARREKAPATVIARLEMPQLGRDKRWRHESQARYAAGLRSLLQSPEIAADPHAQTAVRLELAETLSRSKDIPQAISVLQAVPGTPGLAEQDSMRAAALARLATLQLLAGNAAAAKTTFASSGLTPDQCSLLDAPPRLKAGGASSNDFPMDAYRWGFEGWVRTEFDVAAQGETLHQRATVAYPPFVFSKSAANLARRLRYERTFRPDGAVGCGGLSQQVRFVL